MLIKQLIKNALLRIAIMLLMLGLASAIGFAFRWWDLPKTNIAFVYLLGVLLVTMYMPGYLFGCLASVLSAFAFNYLFTEPYFTFAPNATSYLITFVTMTITSVVTSTIASHAKLNERQAQEREAETKALYALTNRLTDAAEIHDIAGIAAETISTVICEKSACLCFDEKGIPEKAFVQQISLNKQVRREVADPQALLHRIEGLRTGVDIGPEFYDWPIYGREMTLGIIRLPSDTAQSLNKAQTRLLRSMIESVALAMDRFRSAQQRIKLREESEQERYRSNLLRSISHDLRTPLSAILGATEMLFGMTEKEDARYPLIENINKDAGWLHSLVENILSLTRLQDGRLAIRKEPEAVEEILGGAVGHVLRRHPQYEIEVQAPEALFLVPMDARLITQVLINLLDNAIRHTKPPGGIRVIVKEDTKQNQAVFMVQDTGCGIAKADLPNIFQMFYTSQFRHSDARIGIGLGLTICETIINEHGGTIMAQNRMDTSGAEFIFTLPLEEKRE